MLSQYDIDFIEHKLPQSVKAKLEAKVKKQARIYKINVKQRGIAKQVRVNVN